MGAQHGVLASLYCTQALGTQCRQIVSVMCAAGLPPHPGARPCNSMAAGRGKLAPSSFLFFWPCNSRTLRCLPWWLQQEGGLGQACAGGEEGGEGGAAGRRRGEHPVAPAMHARRWGGTLLLCHRILDRGWAAQRNALQQAGGSAPCSVPGAPAAGAAARAATPGTAPCSCGAGSVEVLSGALRRGG